MFAAGAAGQTLSPPIAEYQGKANGVLELRNEGEVPLAVILEAHSFSSDENGDVKYRPLDPGITVEMGANSFTIPAHQVHNVFYKASCTRLPAWFAILNIMTRTTPVTKGLRINIILPHFVEIYQKSKLRKQDVRMKVLPASKAGEYALEIENLSEKLGRVEEIQVKGFEADETYGGFALFPGQSRRLSLKTGAASGRARFRIQFRDGFHLEESLRAALQGTFQTLQ
jgi:hypothetical protein